MIQRIQTVYLTIVILLLSIVTFGTNLFSFVNEEFRYVFNSFGIIRYNKVGSTPIGVEQSFPLYIGLISLILLTFITLMSYKNHARQFKLGRTVFGIYFLILVSLVLLSVFGNKLIDEPTTSRELGLGFFLFVIGFPFSFMANTGIKRDKKLLESLDRLR